MKTKCTDCHKDITNKVKYYERDKKGKYDVLCEKCNLNRP